MFSEYEPFSLEVSIPLHLGWVAFRDEWLMAPRNRLQVGVSDTAPHKNLILVDQVSRWLSQNIQKPYSARYRYPREDGTNYIAFSCLLDVIRFKAKLPDWDR